MSDPSSDHQNLMALWQTQPQESDVMTLQHIQAISRRLDRTELRTTLLMFAVAALASFGVGVEWPKFHDAMHRTVLVLYLLGIAGCFGMVVWMMRLRSDPTEPGGIFLRRRLERNLRLSGSGRSFIVILPLMPWLISVAVIGVLKHRDAPLPPHLSGAQLALNLLPVALLAAAWLAALLIIRPRQRRRLRRYIEELDAAMK